MFLQGQLCELETRAFTQGLGTEGFLLCFTLSCHHRDVFTNFKPGAPYFRFSPGDASDVASPVSSPVGKGLDS